MLARLLADSALMIMATGALVGSAATLVGVFLVLRRNSMLSDAISHSIVFGIVVVWLLTRQQSGPVQLVGAALTGVLTVFLTELLVSTRKVKDDAAIGLVFPALFSIGVLLLNLYARDVHIDRTPCCSARSASSGWTRSTVAGYEVPQALVWMGLVTLLNGGFVAAVLQGAQARDLRSRAGERARLRAQGAVLRAPDADQHDRGRGVRRGGRGAVHRLRDRAALGGLPAERSAVAHDRDRHCDLDRRRACWATTLRSRSTCRSAA